MYNDMFITRSRVFFTGATTHCGFVSCSPLAGYSLLAYEVSCSHTTTRHSRQDSSGRVISPSQRPLPDNTQHSQQTNIHASSGIRTHDLSRRATEDLRLRPRGYWDRRDFVLRYSKYCELKFNMQPLKIFNGLNYLF